MRVTPWLGQGAVAFDAPDQLLEGASHLSNVGGSPARRCSECSAETFSGQEVSPSPPGVG